MHSVYILTVPDGRKYVGTTSMPVKRRWNHGNGYRFCSALWDVICELGWDAIDKEVIGESFTEDEASNLEQNLIAEYQTTNPSFGFNREAGGLRSNKIIPEPIRLRQSESRKGKLNPNFGKHFSEEHRRKIAESNSGQKRSKETCHRIGKAKEKPVAQYTVAGRLLAIYPSGKEAALVTGAQVGHISKVCKGQRRSAGGFVWKFI